jgi:hypothetical protein
LVITPPKAAVASRVASYCTVQVCPAGISIPVALIVVPLDVSVGAAPVEQFEKVKDPPTLVRPTGSGSDRVTLKAS